MNKRVFPWLFLGALALTATAGAADVEIPRRWAASPPVIDGVISAAEWSGAQVTPLSHGQLRTMNDGFAEDVPTLTRTWGISPEEVVQVLGSTPISEKSSRNSQNRWLKAAPGVGPKPGTPSEAGSVFWQPVKAEPPR